MSQFIMKKDVLKFTLFLFVLLAAYFSWFSVSQAITVVGSSVWLVPMICFSLFYILLALEFVLVEELQWTKLSFFLGLFSSLIFVLSWAHLLILIIAGFLMFVSLCQIRKDLDNNIEIALIKSLRMGRTFFILALALAISSQYYFQAEEAGLTKIPTFDAGEFLSNNWVRKTVYGLVPDMQKLENKNQTVDEYIVENYKANATASSDIDSQILTYVEGSQKISPAALQKLEDLKQQKILEAGREQLGKMAGRSLNGSEKVGDIFIVIINNRINGFFNANVSSNNGLSVPGVMSVVFFLTILSLSSFMVRFLAYITEFIFWLLLKSKVVIVKKKPVEMEIITV